MKPYSDDFYYFCCTRSMKRAHEFFKRHGIAGPQPARMFGTFSEYRKKVWHNFIIKAQVKHQFKHKAI